jgi:hypothetical protein
MTPPIARLSAALFRSPESAMRAKNEAAFAGEPSVSTFARLAKARETTDKDGLGGDRVRGLVNVRDCFDNLGGGPGLRQFTG